MKRIATALICTLGLTLCAPCVSAADAPRVTVTIADAEGNLALTQEAVSVTDTDGDGALTINDALYLAHEAGYEGGAAAGYASAQTDYGLSLMKLWGTENGGSYGYYVNSNSAMSLSDPVSDGDCIDAFVYTDLTAWSDTYCFFDVLTLEADAGSDITLTLSAASYDENWNPITVPVADAVITLNGEETAYQTDAEGKVTFSVPVGGDYVISAFSDTMTLVPPCCVAAIAGGSAETTTTTDSAASTTTTTTASSVETGEHVPAAALCVAAVALLTVLCATIKYRR